jgi:transposase
LKFRAIPFTAGSTASDALGIVGLMNKPGRGRKPILSLHNPAHVASVTRRDQKQCPKCQNGRCRTGKHSRHTDERRYGQAFFKKLDFSFHRIRTSLKSRPAGSERVAKETALKRFWKLFRHNWIDLYFGDEASFSMNPVLPYARREKGKPIEIFPPPDKKANLFGIFRPDNVAATYRSEGNINSEFLIQSINDFCQYLEKPTVLALDNGSTHRSKLFFGQLAKWEEKGFYIFFLPKYSPHLNMAEIYWRKAKYEWLKPTDYFSFARCKQKIKEIFNGIGIDDKIVFKELKI